MQPAPVAQPALVPVQQPIANARPNPGQPAPVVQPPAPQPAALQQVMLPAPMQQAVLAVPQQAASVAVPTGLFLGDGVLPLPQKLMRKIRALEFICESCSRRSDWDRWRTGRVRNSTAAVTAPAEKESPPSPTSSHGYKGMHPLLERWPPHTRQKCRS